MSTRSALELKVRITIVLLLWAAICLTTFSGRSTILNSKLKSDTKQNEKNLPEYVMNWDKLND
ncbi:hypothetical protein WJR50_06535 [Catalinimonas sp. 4WD22]|uniref:hypothetical protein n=1 Tax=Catalinimonas locisalis TaxID=3133978 RepID=UPI003100CD9D